LRSAPSGNVVISTDSAAGVIRALVRARGTLRVAGAAQQVGVGGVQRLVALELRSQRLEQREPGGGTGREPDRDGVVELDGRRRLQDGERPVEPGDPIPVDGRLELRRGDRRLQLVLARRPDPHGALELRQPQDDALLVPQRPVLRVERDVAAARVHAPRAPRVVQQHQRRQAPDLGVLGHQRAQQLAEADRLVAELVADESVTLGRRVALVEDQIHDPQHTAQAVGQLLVGRDAVGDVRVGDLALRARSACP
jgi:hypothetical protein